MRIFILLIFITNFLFSHSAHFKNNKNKDLTYGFFADTLYESKKQYPDGIPLSFGYENHQKEKELGIIHYGGYINKIFEKISLNLELNKHKGANNKLNNIVEQAYISYNFNNSYFKIGRSNNNISFLDEESWTYNFIKAPLFLDSYFDKSIYLDGIFLKYNKDNFNTYLDLGKQIFTNKLRKNIKISYIKDNYTFLSYHMSTKKTTNFYDSSNSTDNHSHSHSINNIDCTKLQESALCFDEDKKLYALGIYAIYDKFRVLSEYTLLKKQGEIYSSTSLVNSLNKLHNFYIQVQSRKPKLNYSLRSEAFWYDLKLKGLGTQNILNNIEKQTSKINYLHTFALNYKLNKNHKIYLEALISNENEISGKFLYKLNFSN